MRLVGQVKMGYYPTPLTVVERVKTFIKATGKACFLDPCCGEGLALERLALSFGAKTYGIEIDKARAKKAKELLGNVLKCGYEQAFVSNSAFSLLFLNPPYDWEAGDESNERKEKVFLKNTVKYLQPLGLLVGGVPVELVEAPAPSGVDALRVL